MKIRVTSPLGVDIQPSALTVMSAEGKHDLLTFRIKAQTANRVTLFQSGMPILTEWTDNSGKRGIAYGYVESVSTPHVLESPPALRTFYTDVVAMGTTYVFKNEDRQTWANQLSAPIVQALANKNGFSAIIDPSDYLWDTLAQGGASDWSLLKMMASTLGYTLTNRGAALFFLDRRLVMARATPIPYVVDPGSAGDVLDFRPQASDGVGISETAGQWSIAGQGGLTGGAFTLDADPTKTFFSNAKNTPLFTRVAPGVARSIKEAIALLDGVTGANMFTNEATIVLQGNPLIRASSVLSLAFPGADENSGNWYVKEATHVIGPQNYSTQCLIGKDGFGGSTNTVPLYGKQTSDKRPKNYPPTVYRNGQWMSAWSTP